MSLLEKNKAIRPLRTQARFDFLKKNGKAITCKWLKGFYFFDKDQKFVEVAWGFSKKNVPRCVDRNRLKRWARANLKKQKIQGKLLMVLLQRDRNFYRCLKRKDFDVTFFKFMEKLHQVSQ